MYPLNESQTLAFFAGIWTRWTSVRKVKEDTTNDIFRLPETERRCRAHSCQGNALDFEFDVWMTAPAKEALSAASIAGWRVAHGARREIGWLTELNEAAAAPAARPTRRVSYVLGN